MSTLLPIVTILYCYTPSLALTLATLYQLNHNLSLAALGSALVEEEVYSVRGVLDCAHLCNQKNSNGFDCNGFVIDKESISY